MTDLERAREALLKLSPIQAVMALVEAARREGAEAEKVNITALAEEAYSHGAEEMRERAAQVAAKYDATSPSNVGNIHPDYFYGQENAADGIADAIRALPLTPEEPT